MEFGCCQQNTQEIKNRILDKTIKTILFNISFAFSQTTHIDFKKYISFPKGLTFSYLFLLLLSRSNLWLSSPKSSIMFYGGFPIISSPVDVKP